MHLTPQSKLVFSDKARGKHAVMYLKRMTAGVQYRILSMTFTNHISADRILTELLHLMYKDKCLSYIYRSPNSNLRIFLRHFRKYFSARSYFVNL